MKLKNLFASGKEDSYPINDSLHEDDVCCGQHDVCEKELLIKAASQAIEYYDDEELDKFQGRSSDSYEESEVELFAEVLHTMWESDVSGWLRSLQLRGIELPDELKDEVILLIN
ncbi:phospholipase [Bacteroidales bacterium OttesenSCG-928-I14]|nr:phospholipase [Bacteroidales bacterium OttesenSCG-928-I14]